MTHRFSAPLLFLVLSLTKGALAEDNDSRVAQSLFDEGRERMEAGDLVHACPMLAESEKIEHAGGTLLNLALCHEKAGLLATAWTEFNGALSAAIRDERADRKEFAELHIDALRVRVPRLRIRVAEAEQRSTMRILVNDRELPSAAEDVATPIDPGWCLIHASAPDRKTWTTRVELMEGKTLDVVVPPLDKVLAPKGSTHFGTATYVTFGVALASLATSAISGGFALDANHTAESKCVAARNYCPDPTAMSDASRARALAWTSTITLGAGLVLGVVAWFLPRQHHKVPSLARTAIFEF